MKEWDMVIEILEAYGKGEIDLHGNHALFLKELHDHMDENLSMEDQCPEWMIKKLYWLYEWHIEQNYMPENEFEL